MKKRSFKIAGSGGFTLVELLVVLAVCGVAMAAIARTFKSQQNSYVVQERTSILQQSVRGAMHLMARDIRMGGFYTSFGSETFTMDWDGDGNTETMAPLIFGRDDDDLGGNDVKDGTDMISITKVSEDRRALFTGEGNPGSDTTVIVNPDLNNDGVDDLNTDSKPYGVLIRGDLNRAEFFKVVSTTSGSLNVGSEFTFTDSYMGPNDIIARADIIAYRIDDNGTLQRTNLGNDGNSQPVADGITDMQILYHIDDGSISGVWLEADDPGWSQWAIMAVQITITGGMNIPGASGEKTRTITSTVRIRNIDRYTY